MLIVIQSWAAWINQVSLQCEKRAPIHRPDRKSWNTNTLTNASSVNTYTDAWFVRSFIHLFSFSKHFIQDRVIMDLEVVNTLGLATCLSHGIIYLFTASIANDLLFWEGVESYKKPTQPRGRIWESQDCETSIVWLNYLSFHNMSESVNGFWCFRCVIIQFCLGFYSMKWLS